VERWFGMLTEKQIRRGTHRNTAELEAAIRLYLGTHNENPKPFIWSKTADQILASGSRPGSAGKVGRHSLPQQV
jgi:hypothetical protein